MKRKIINSKDTSDTKKNSSTHLTKSKKADSNKVMTSSIKKSTQAHNSKYGTTKNNYQSDSNSKTNITNSSNKKVKNNSSNHMAIESININYSKLVEDDQKKIDDIKGKLVIQNKLLEEKKKELNKIKLENEKLKDNVYRKNKELEKVKKDKTEYETLNNNMNTKINEITQTIEEQRQRQINLLRRREMMMNYLMSMLIGLRRRNDDYPNVDNMSYEELLALEDRIGNVNKGLTKEQINKLKKEKYVKNKFIDDKCIVCQYEFKSYEKLILLPCKHCFHPDCITQWLEKQKICPYCKSEVKI